MFTDDEGDRDDHSLEDAASDSDGHSLEDAASEIRYKKYNVRI